jgi:cytochrome c oxidase subunit 2
MFSINKALGIVPNASEHGANVDHMLELCHWFMTFLFIGWSIFFCYTLWRFHHTRHAKANYHGVKSKAATHLEFTVIIIELGLLLGFAYPQWNARVGPESWPDLDKDKVLRVHVIAQQFAWNFHYPGPDGVFGKQDASLVSNENAIGLDKRDPAAADDFTSPQLHVEQFRPTLLEITSKDVIHSFAVQSMRVMQDAIPGNKVPLWFKPIKTGEYEIICAQLCGANHYAMKGTMVCDSKADFDAFMKQSAPAPAPAAAKTASTASGFQQLAQQAAAK